MRLALNGWPAVTKIFDACTKILCHSNRSKGLLAIRLFECVTSVAAFPDCYQVIPGTEARSARVKGRALVLVLIVGLQD